MKQFTYRDFIKELSEERVCRLITAMSAIIHYVNEEFSLQNSNPYGQAVVDEGQFDTLYIVKYKDHQILIDLYDKEEAKEMRRKRDGYINSDEHKDFIRKNSKV